MKLHPFCGAKMSTKLKLVTAFDMIVSTIALQLNIIVITLKVGFGQEFFSLTPSPNNFTSSINLSTVMVFSLFLIVDLMLDVWLWIIIAKKDKSKCLCWVVMKLTLELCDAIGFAVEVTLGQHSSSYIASMLLDFLFTAFFLWAVYVYMCELHKAPIHLLHEGGQQFVSFKKFFKNGSKRGEDIGDEEALKSVINEI